MFQKFQNHLEITFTGSGIDILKIIGYTKKLRGFRKKKPKKEFLH